MNQLCRLYVPVTLGSCGFIMGGLSIVLQVEAILGNNHEELYEIAFLLGGSICGYIFANNPYTKKIQEILDS